jgi:hypothetical protein
MSNAEDLVMLAHGNEDGSVTLWDASTGAEKRALKGLSQKSIYCIAFSPQNLILATGSGDTNITLSDPSTGKIQRSLRGHSSYVFCLAFSCDGSMLASGSGDTNIIIWDPISGDKLKTLKGHSHNVWSVAFSPDGSRLASGSRDKSLIIWNTCNGERHLTLQCHSGYVLSVVFSPDGSMLASGSEDKSIVLSDPVTGQTKRTLQGHCNGVWSVAFSPDGSMLASGSADKSIILWDPYTGKKKLTLPGHSSYVLSMAFSPNGNMLASGSDDKSLKLWDTRKSLGTAVWTMNTDSSVRSVAFFSFAGKKVPHVELHCRGHPTTDSITTVRVPVPDIQAIVGVEDDNDNTTGEDRVKCFISATPGEARKKIEDRASSEAKRLGMARTLLQSLEACACARLSQKAQDFRSIVLARTPYVELGTHDEGGENGGDTATTATATAEETIVLDLHDLVECPEANFSNLPLIFLRVLAAEMCTDLPKALERMDAWLARTRAQLNWRQAALDAALAAKNNVAKSPDDSAVRSDVAQSIMHACESLRTSNEHVHTSITKNSSTSISARDYTAATLTHAQQCLTAARAAENSAKNAQVKAKATVGRITEEDLPRIADEQARAVELQALENVLQEHEKTVQLTSAHVLCMQNLVEALEQASTVCNQVCTQFAEAHVPQANECLARTKAAIDARAPMNECIQNISAQTNVTMQLEATAQQALVAVQEHQELCNYATERVSRAKQGWRRLHEMLTRDVEQMEMAHFERLRAANLSAVKLDDLRIVLMERGLAECFDKMSQVCVCVFVFVCVYLFCVCVYIYIYIYICVCVCVCVSQFG